MNCPDFTEKERDECKDAIDKLDDALARITTDVEHAKYMLRGIRCDLTDVLNPPDKAKGGEDDTRKSD